MNPKSKSTTVQVTKTFRAHIESGRHTLSFSNGPADSVELVRLSVCGSEIAKAAGESGFPFRMTIEALTQLRDLCDTGIRVWEEMLADNAKG